MRLDYEEAARQALAWLVTDGLATEVKVEAVITGVNALGLAVTITEPDGKTGTLRYRVNWQGQRTALGEAG